MIRLAEMASSPNAKANADGPRLGKMKGLPVAQAAKAGINRRQKISPHKRAIWLAFVLSAGGERKWALSRNR